MEASWARLGGELSGGKGMPRAAFMLHQYATVLAAYGEKNVDGGSPSVGTAVTHVERGHARATSDFVDETIESHFKVLMTFVRKVEVAAGSLARAQGLAVPAIAGAVSSEAGASGLPASSKEGAAGAGQGGIPSFLPEGVTPPAEPAETEAIVRDFAINWKSGLSGLNEDVTKYFGRDVRAAMAVLKAAFSRFVETHARLAAVVGKAFPNAAWARDLIPLQTIYFEMRRYGRATE